MKIALSLGVLLATLVAGCGGGSPPPKASTATPSSASSTAPGEATPADDTEPPAPPAAGFAELKAAVLACPFDEGGDIDTSCEAYASWDNETAAFEGGKSNAALLEMIASADPKARLMAAQRLLTTVSENTDPALVEKVLVAGEKETVPTIVTALAKLAASLDLVNTGKVERALAVAKGHKLADYPETFLLHLGWSTKDKAFAVYAREASKSGSSSMRTSALNALGKLAPDYPAEACKPIETLLSDKDKFASNRAASTLASVGKCSAHFDKLLDKLAAVDVKKDVDQDYGIALHNLCGQTLTDKQRDRANKAARRITDAPAVKTNTRYYTLSAVILCDAKDGKAYVEKFKTDKEATIANRAAELTK